MDHNLISNKRIGEMGYRLYTANITIHQQESTIITGYTFYIM